MKEKRDKIEKRQKGKRQEKEKTEKGGGQKKNMLTTFEYFKAEFTASQNSKKPINLKIRNLATRPPDLN